MLYWFGLSSPKKIGDWNDDFFWKKVRWARINEEYPKASLFGSGPSILDPIQSDLGNCYAIAAMISVAIKPERIRDLFIIDEKNKAGIYAVKLYIRAKPYVVTVDDSILMWSHSLFNENRVKDKHRFVKGKVDERFWPIILEKAIAKMRGNYANMEAGFINVALRLLTGAPTIVRSIYYNIDLEMFYKYMKPKFNYDFPIIFGTSGYSNTNLNYCGINKMHAYSLLSILELEHNNVTHRLLMMKNPLPSIRHYYNKAWSKDDPRWN